MKNNQKIIKTVLGVLVLTGVFAFTGYCAANDAAQEKALQESEQQFTFTDDLGRQITVCQPQRVAALLGSFADMWYLAGGEVTASADDAWEEFDLPMAEDAVNLGMTKELSLEKLFASDPELVLASTNTKQHMEWKETLEAAGITTAYFDVSDFEDYLRVLKIFTDMTGRKDLYMQNGLSLQTQIQELAEEANNHIEEEKERPTVLVLRSSASWVRAKNSQNNVLGEMLAALGCKNIADSDESLLETLSLEHIMMEDPDHIFICQASDTMEEVRMHMEAFIQENPAWNSLTAVQEGHIHYMEKELYNLKPNDRWAEAYQKAEELLFHGKK